MYFSLFYLSGLHRHTHIHTHIYRERGRETERKREGFEYVCVEFGSINFTIKSHY